MYKVDKTMSVRIIHTLLGYFNPQAYCINTVCCWIREKKLQLHKGILNYGQNFFPAMAIQITTVVMLYLSLI